MNINQESKRPVGPMPSALAQAKRSSDIVMTWSAEDVRAIRPAWSEREAEEFLYTHKAEFVGTIMTVSVALMMRLIERHDDGGEK